MYIHFFHVVPCEIMLLPYFTDEKLRLINLLNSDTWSEITNQTSLQDLKRFSLYHSVHVQAHPKKIYVIFWNALSHGFIYYLPGHPFCNYTMTTITQCSGFPPCLWISKTCTDISFCLSQDKVKASLFILQMIILTCFRILEKAYTTSCKWSYQLALGY